MRLAIPLLLLAISAPLAGAQTTQPAAGDNPDAAIELRATQAFNKGDYAVALPMLQKLQTDLSSDPMAADKLAMIAEQIHVCAKGLQDKPTAAPASAVTAVGDATATAAVPPAPKAEERKPHPAPKPGEVQEMAIKDLGNFTYDPEQNTPIPADVKALNDSSVRLHGYMVPLDQAENISRFALVPSLFNCCYGQPPQIQHTIIVTCPKGKAVSYYPDEIVVEGKLKVDVMKDDGFIVGIFAIDAASVKPAAK